MYTELKDAWRDGNNAGKGFALGSEDMTPEEAAIDVGLENIEAIDPEGSVTGYLAGDTYVICDLYGPWAVVVKEED